LTLTLNRLSFKLKPDTGSVREKALGE
jgi:hypothetical protein